VTRQNRAVSVFMALLIVGLAPALVYTWNLTVMLVQVQYVGVYAICTPYGEGPAEIAAGLIGCAMLIVTMVFLFVEGCRHL